LPLQSAVGLVARQLALRDFMAILVEHLAYRREQPWISALGVERPVDLGLARL
jgi:hypothetical protein